jgi:putative membrane protein
MHWNSDWHMGWMGMWWILIVPVVIAVVWFALSAARRRNNGAQESPEQVLKRRYAKGEIDHATFQRILTELKG